MTEFLSAHGHPAAELLDCSLDRLRDLFADAQARVGREQAQLELSMMNAVATGAGSLMTKKGVQIFNREQKRLVARANGDDQQNVPANLQRLSENLLSIGAKRSYSQPKLTGPWKTKSQ